MKIAVLVKQVPDTDEERRLDPASGLLDRLAGENVADEINERALEVALSHKDSHKGTEVVVISLGPESVTKALRKVLSMGADSAVHVLDEALAGADAGRTAVVLAAAVKQAGVDLVVAGNESTDGRGGVVPAMVAEQLGLPHLSFLDAVEISAGSVTGERGTDSGSMVVSAPLPAVISVTERSAEARFPNFRGIMMAKRKPLSVVSLADLGMDPDFAGMGRSVVVTTSARPLRTAGKKIVDEGNAGTRLAEFLVAEQLV
ncbi:electron transfer flavoprotein subunit beta/FixA family protein [Specibacter cremeus]|uniref:electron transfer flavoprotein subunit beta/FixA family protein n=1 Tax=Specibacter cremeus TaxID=1629051 RepID=UPI000F7791DA|nr:electron transfer flavoprotein subunit beta/FixA family protein [Specibacter cremeus]